MLPLTLSAPMSDRGVIVSEKSGRHRGKKKECHAQTSAETLALLQLQSQTVKIYHYLQSHV